MLRYPLMLSVVLFVMAPAIALERPDVTFKIFQFPPDMIPRIDGNTDDWAMVPDSYAIGMNQLEDTEAPGGHGINRDPMNLDVKVKVGWVEPALFSLRGVRQLLGLLTPRFTQRHLRSRGRRGPIRRSAD